MQVYFEIFKGTELLSQGEIDTPFDLGRQSPSELESKPVFQYEVDGRRKLVFVSVEETTIPRRALQIDLSTEDTLIVRNIHQGFQMKLSDGRSLSPGGEVRSREPICFLFDGDYRAQFSRWPFPSVESDPANLERSFRFRLPPSPDGHSNQNTLNSLTHLSNDLDQLQAVQLVKSALRAFKEVPGTETFFRSVVTAVLEMIDVERALVLVRQNDTWVQMAMASYSHRGNRSIECQSDTNTSVPFSRTLLQRVLELKSTIIIEPELEMNLFAESMREIQRAVASPVFDEHREVVAVLYADKRFGGQSDRPIGDIEATLLEVLASGVSSGLLRQKDEAFRAEAARFFSPRVLERIREKRDLLEGKDAEVSVLFCDVRGFSSTSHRIGPSATIAWINDVFTSLSESVLRHDGVVVNYIGDELIAMFGAPEEQRDHATRAFRTAQDILSSLPMLNSKWGSTTVEEFSVGIGVNTGIARVGNTGSRLKFQYGPLGNTVNIASRVQSITKLLGVRGLMTGETEKGIQKERNARRLINVRVVGVPDPIELFEISIEPSSMDPSLTKHYEEALHCYEGSHFGEAKAILESLVKKFPSDQPSRILLARVHDALKDPTKPFDSVWTLTQK